MHDDSKSATNALNAALRRATVKLTPTAIGPLIQFMDRPCHAMEGASGRETPTHAEPMRHTTHHVAKTQALRVTGMLSALGDKASPTILTSTAANPSKPRALRARARASGTTSLPSRMLARHGRARMLEAALLTQAVMAHGENEGLPARRS